VAENSDSMRPLLVRHEGRRKLKVKAAALDVEALEEAVTSFSSLIRQVINPVLHDTLICNFSTTTPNIRTASEVVLMDSFSCYFDYCLNCVCGIPRITIEGTPEDWRSIRARVEVLATYDLEWWVTRLLPILDEFLLAAEGRPTQEFWQAIYKPKKAYGDTVATGWVNDLFPYLGDAPQRHRNYVFQHDRQDWALTVDQGIDTEVDFYRPQKGVGLNSFPSGLSSAQVTVSFRDGSQKEVDLVAGYLAVVQNSLDLTLSPFISWCAVESSKMPFMVR
jgi:hypothetical protein